MDRTNILKVDGSPVLVVRSSLGVQEVSRENQILSIVNSPDYRYFDDGRNTLVEQGIDPLSAVDVVVGSAMRKMEDFDALVLVHPDYLKTEKRQLYRRAVEGVVEGCLKVDKPVFCLRFDEEYESGLKPSVFTDTTPYPRQEGLDDDDPVVCQTEVDKISSLLRKEPSETRLAWGGMLADMCVAQWRDRICRDTSPQFEDFTRQTGRTLENPIEYGESLPETVSY